MDPKYLKPDFIIACAILIWYIMPGSLFSWTQYGESGLTLTTRYGSSGLVLLAVPLAAGYIIISRVYGETGFTIHAKRAVLIGVGAYMLLTIISTMSWGFYIAVAGGCYLWWETMNKKA